MSEALKIIQDPTLTYRQELVSLARLGESTDDSLRYSDAYYAAKAKGALCDLNEGVMPFRPRYICPDYDLLFRKGCEFLQLDPPKDLLEAVNVLEIFYCHVPSITTYPVYLGDLDRLLEPFVVREDRAYAKKVLGLFLRNIDRVQTDSFVHADIGPEDSVCYNGLSIGGGGYTLPRMRLYECSLDAKDPADFLDRELPKYIDLQLEYMDKRVKFIVEESSFFKTNFLVTEGFVKRENFIGMFGVVGLAECCNHLLGISDVRKGFGMDPEATALGRKIMEKRNANYHK